MKQIEKDAIIMRQIVEKIMEVMIDNNVVYSKENIHRLAQIVMAWSVTMTAMSCNDIKDFRDKTKDIINKFTSMLETMDPNERGKLMKSVSEQLEFFNKVRELNEVHDKDLN